MNILFGIIFICFGLFALLMTRHIVRQAGDIYNAYGWKVNMKIYKYFWIIASTTFIIFGALQLLGIIKTK